MLDIDADILIRAHRFWCGELASVDHYPADKAALWFERRDETDEAIRAAFGAALDAVSARDWDLASLSREAQIGLVIFLDQFPRNLFRADPRAYAYDERARAVARALVEGGVDRFRLIERCFLYLPFEHSEALADQDLSVRLYEELLADAPAEQADIYRNFLTFAEKHRALIQRFGRFPHRNAELGRISTPDEAAFLAESGRGY
jgi:uncharacterized protein (DUF924 family)